MTAVVSRKSTWVDATERPYFVKANGTTDDTAALQAFATDIVEDGKYGYLPPGTMLISDSIDVPCRPGWRIMGSGRYVTSIKQATDNIPIWYMGSDAASLLHSWVLADMSLTYANNQPSANTNANCIHFEKTPFKFRIEEINFDRGAYGIKVKNGIDGPWGGKWDQLTFASGLTGGAMDWTGSTSGTPNNVWGRMDVDCLNMVGPVFVIKGYNWTIDSIEFLRANLGPNLMTFASGSRVKIGAIKLEIGSYAANKAIFDFLTGCKADIGLISVGGTTMETTNNAVVNVLAAGTGGGSTHRVTVDAMDVQATALSGSLNCVAGSNITLGKYEVSGGARLLNNGSTATAETTWVNEFTNHRMSANKGDADYTVTLGDPNKIPYRTTLTAPRTVTLPSDGNNMHNGLYYRIIVNGAVNGANPLIIKSAATTLHTETNDKRIIEFTWQRNVNANLGWVMTGYATTP